MGTGNVNERIILRDTDIVYAAGDVEHFKYLMRRLGYIFKSVLDGSAGSRI